MGMPIRSIFFLLIVPLGLFAFPIDHPVSTSNPEAQRLFNHGLAHIFAYNHDLAFREFENASKLDPNLAMAYWGMALALGQNVNTDVDRERELRCYDYIQKALKLSSPREEERKYIAALATRYTNDPHVDLTSMRRPYKEAMGKLVQEYPQDLDAATLYAESILDIYPWKWWTPEGKPAEGTLQAAEVLESVLARDPMHIGANHFYVHANEESPHPERALLSADRLTYLFPESGHLLHMPCHIYLLTGDYDKAIQTNMKAIQADWEYILQYGMGGEYPLHYLSHNLYVFARTYMLKGDYPIALQTALLLNQFLKPYIGTNPHLDRYAYVPLEVMLYFNQWNDILNYQILSKSPVTQSFWHYSRGVALAAQGDVQGALNEKKLLETAQKAIPAEEEISNNPAAKVFELAGVLLDGAIAKAKNQPQEYLKALNQGISLQDQFFYDEPPAWSTPLRQTLGEALLEQSKFSEAETAFKQALQKYQRNPRSLDGLLRSLQGQNRTWDAFWVQRELDSSHSGSYTKMNTSPAQ